MRGQGNIALVVSMSGIGALLLEGGRTAHSRFRLPVPPPLDGASCNVKPRSLAAPLLRDAAVIIWDEAPNAPKAAVQAVDELLQEVFHRLPFLSLEAGNGEGLLPCSSARMTDGFSGE